MARCVSIYLRPTDRLYSFDPGDLDVRPGDMVVVETEKGLELGRVVTEPKDRDGGEQEGITLRPVLRKATPDDLAKRKELSARVSEALDTAREWATKLDLPMKFVGAHYTLDGGQAFFFFWADDRVDFRQLLRRLNEALGVRVELRQIGTRDEAKITGGLGRCGRPVCCAQWLTSFTPVTIRMAKDQALPISAEGLSGLCSRLRCCLKYECEQYQAVNKLLPRVNEVVDTPSGQGRVADVHAIKETVRVRFEDGDVREFPLEVVTRQGKSDRAEEQPPDSAYA